ncbi:MAG: acyltransferase [Candidatus Zixiibacteriota bacterium]
MLLLIKKLFLIISFIAAFPLILLTWLEAWICGEDCEYIYCSCRDILSICPTFIGIYLRKAFYWAVCTDVSPDAHFLFGSWLSHRRNTIRSGVVVGHYSFIGYADIGQNVLMAARVSIVSGKYQHGMPGQRSHMIKVVEKNEIISIGENTWIGQDVTILANIGKNCTVGAGSVVLRDVPDNTTVLGNPARKVNIDKDEDKGYIS